MSTMNLTLLTDLYELTMMQGYFESKKNETVIFDAFYRVNPCGNGFATCLPAWIRSSIISRIFALMRRTSLTCGVSHCFTDDFLDYLANFHFSGDIYAIPEGTVMFPREPMIKVIAPIMEAQLVETAILNIINHQSLIATKTARVVYAAKGDGIMEFGLRRAQGPDAGIYGARAAMIGGCIGTSNVLTGQLFDVPVKGTHAHSWIMSFPDEYTAFKTYSKLYPECLHLAGRYVRHTEFRRAKLPSASSRKCVQTEPDLKFYGIRLDSGDLAYLSKQARKMLDEAGFTGRDHLCFQRPGRDT